MEEYIADFLVETAEALAALDNDLIRLEANPGDTTLISSIFRTLHTVKGTCGFLGLAKLGKVAHAGENVLGRMREGTLAPTPENISVVLRCVDAIKLIVTTLGATGGEGEDDHAALIGELDTLFRSKAADSTGPAPSDSDELQALFDATPGPDLPRPPKPAEAAPAPPPPAPAAAQPAPARPAAKAAEPPRETALANQTIRVGIDLLEGLMTTVSELVLSRNQLLQLLRAEKDSPFAAPLQRLSMITSELQESVMKTRMQPIGNAWSTLPRIVRDLARELGKKIELAMEGSETELDRQVLELIKDPLTHMVRNSADHGLESTADRVASGKPETGQIRLIAFHEGGHIIIQVSDDGRGLDAEKIRRKAVQSGLATEADAAQMSDAAVFRFIMRPGFSTAATVTAVSGRGVGMDVVRANIERIGGTIDIASQLGLGATFTIKIPLTLAIVPALIVGCAGERFAVPQISVIELVSASGTGEHRIERISDAAVLRLRDRLLPLVDLQTLLALPPPAEPAKDRLIIVTQVGAWRFGIIVDHVYDTEEIVVKPVAPLMKGLGVYSGNTILGDGSVCMIVDPNGIVARTGRSDALPDTEGADAPAQRARQGASTRQRMLLVRAGQGLRKAIPLALIARLEDIEVKQIRRSDDGRLLVMYRDSLMPLVPATDDLAVRETGRQPVLVFTERQAASADGAHLDRRPRQVGVLVDEIVDILESDVSIEIDSTRSDIIGSAIIAGEPTEVLNVAWHLQRADVNWAGGASTLAEVTP
jgi:two-component system chemotaxis sensor kinase CheA